jgi:hypothetical protein
MKRTVRDDNQGEKFSSRLSRYSRTLAAANPDQRLPMRLIFAATTGLALFRGC